VVPIVGLVAGILCVVAGVLLLFRARRKSVEADEADQPVEPAQL
jgi:hypothetical protein